MFSRSGSNSANLNRNMTLPTINDNFKITLRQQTPNDPNKNLPGTVTSTIPKTPSPNHVQGKSDTERSLDKFCEDSVKDLMATIAKLDSNGVQVLAEGRQKVSPLFFNYSISLLYFGKELVLNLQKSFISENNAVFKVIDS